MNIYAEEGSKIVFKHSNNGWDHDKTTAQKYLELNQVYTVGYTVVHSSQTDVYVKEIPGIRFNSVQFEDMEEITMKKVEALKGLIETINKQDELADGEYVSGCQTNNCAIGLLLKNAGVSNEQLTQLDEGTIYGSDYEIQSIMITARSGEVDEMEDFVGAALEKLGFDLYDDELLLQEIQQANDHARNGERKADVIAFIERKIEELENAN